MENRKPTFREQLIRRYDDDHIVHYCSAADFPGLDARKIGFRTPQGNGIVGYIYSYPNPSKGDLVVFCHGIGGGHRSYMREIERICREGYEALAYDNVGCFESEGTDIRGLTEFINDLVSCLDWISGEEGLNGRGIHIMGHSCGGYAASNILSLRRKSIRSITSISAFASLGILEGGTFVGLDMNEYFDEMMANEKKVNPDYVQCCSAEAVKDAEIPVLLIHSKDDPFVSFSNDIGYLQTVIDNPNVRFLATDGKGHNPNYTKDAVDYMAKSFGEYARLIGEGSLKTDEEKKAFMDKLDFVRMTEQDDQIWSAIFDNMGGR